MVVIELGVPHIDLLCHRQLQMAEKVKINLIHLQRKMEICASRTHMVQAKRYIISPLMYPSQVHECILMGLFARRFHHSPLLIL